MHLRNINVILLIELPGGGPVRDAMDEFYLLYISPEWSTAFGYDEPTQSLRQDGKT